MPINPTLFLIFTAVTSIGVLIQAGVLFGMFLAATRAAKKVEDITDQLNVHLIPAVATTKQLLEDVVPKLRTITEDVAAITAEVRHQTEHVNTAVDEVVDRTRVQAERVDEMVTSVLNSVVHASTTIQHGIGNPLRQISGILDGVRVGVSTLWRKETEDREAF
ncbi:MAG: hypothetical protein HIU93_07200 [Acidobacteria bacterium]|nr:hypothetical protein [Acidobacteriota bacterium]MBW4045753.1 hypothetical protein [Acidobacteriota bacterium]